MKYPPIPGLIKWTLADFKKRMRNGGEPSVKKFLIQCRDEYSTWSSLVEMWDENLETYDGRDAHVEVDLLDSRHTTIYEIPHITSINELNNMTPTERQQLYKPQESDEPDE